MPEITGIDLHQFGIADIGLNPENAARALEYCEAQGLRVVGGDLYHYDGEHLTVTYDNFSCGGSDPVESTIENARNFLKQFGENENSLFTFVIQL